MWILETNGDGVWEFFVFFLRAYFLVTIFVDPALPASVPELTSVFSLLTRRCRLSGCIRALEIEHRIRYENDR